MKLFLDTEFTSLEKESQLISIGIISENGITFYGEFNDYDNSKIDDWVNDNVIKYLKFNESDDYYNKTSNLHKQEYSIEVKGDKETIKQQLIEWFEQFDNIEIWSDCLAYDWVLFNDIFGHAFNIPKNIYYIPFDICTLFKICNLDPDISREKFIDNSVEGDKHNSLYDAKVIRECYNKLIKYI